MHLDVKKIGRISGRGGWRAHGPGSNRGAGRSVGYTYLRSAVDGFTRLAYTEALEDERAVAAIRFFCRARTFFTAHRITVDRAITDNGNNYRAADLTPKVASLGGRHHRTRPYTPPHNGKIERYNRLMVDEVLCTRSSTSEQARHEALQSWVNHNTYHRPQTSCGEARPTSPAPDRVNDATPSSCVARLRTNTRGTQSR